VTPEDFAALFPGQPFAIRWVEHGEYRKRSFFWHVMFTSDYWTSDSCSAVYDHCAPDHPDGKGETLDAAFDDLLKKTVKRAQARLEASREELAEREQLLRDAEKLVKP
jgi:hypothetical protein